MGTLEAAASSPQNSDRLPAETVEEEALRVLERDTGSDTRAELEQDAAILEGAGQFALARDVRATIRKLRKQCVLGHTKLKVALKTNTVRGWRAAEEVREAVASDDRRLKELKARETSARSSEI